KAVEYLLKPINPEELNEALAQCVSELKTSLSAPIIETANAVLFSDNELLVRYMDLREHIYAALLELNAVKVRSGFHRLSQELYAQKLPAGDAGIPAKLGNDYLLMLEQYVAGQGSVLERLLPESNNGIGV